LKVCPVLSAQHLSRLLPGHNTHKEGGCRESVPAAGTPAPGSPPPSTPSTPGSHLAGPLATTPTHPAPGPHLRPSPQQRTLEVIGSRLAPLWRARRSPGHRPVRLTTQPRCRLALPHSVVVGERCHGTRATPKAGSHDGRPQDLAARSALHGTRTPARLQPASTHAPQPHTRLPTGAALVARTGWRDHEPTREAPRDGRSPSAGSGFVEP